MISPRILKTCNYLIKFGRWSKTQHRLRELPTNYLSDCVVRYVPIVELLIQSGRRTVLLVEHLQEKISLKHVTIVALWSEKMKIPALIVGRESGIYKLPKVYRFLVLSDNLVDITATAIKSGWPGYKGLSQFPLCRFAVQMVTTAGHLFLILSELVSVLRLVLHLQNQLVLLTKLH